MVQHHLEPPGILLSTFKRNVLVAKICLFSGILAVLHVTLDVSQGLYECVIIDLLLAVIIGFAWLLNRWRYHLISKIFVLFSLNLLFILFASTLPVEVGIYLYYFPLLVASSALFDPEERYFRYFFIGLPLTMLGILIFLEFDLFKSSQFESPMNSGTFFAINAASSAIITIICVNFMQKLNTSSERELKELAEEVNAKNIHLEKTNAELDRFLYSTSHDLRSPLSSIKGLVNIARMETADEKLQSYFTMMVDRVDKLDFFIKDIIDYSRNARTEMETESVDFHALLEEVNENLKYLEGAETIRFERQVSVAHDVKADKNRLAVVLNNLIANAIKYHDPRKEQQWIKVAVANSNGTLKIEVSDNGIGIDQEHHGKVFDMFYRGTFQSKGSGLGLYIVQETVAKMKGTIALKSTSGKGSSFLITLPVS